MKKVFFTAFIALYSCLVIAAPDDYYIEAFGKTGNELKMALHTIIDNHTVLEYTNRNNDNWIDGENIDVWEALVYTDSACDELAPDCGMIVMLYTNDVRHISKANRGSGGNDMWDREHVWPKSRGFPNKSQDGYTDLHHLRPADRNINGVHSNYGYDEGGEIVYDKLSDEARIPTTARIDRINQSFEPTNIAKGQIARMIFYMAVRYDEGDNNSPEKMPDLFIKDENAKIKEPWIGDLCTLLKWHQMYGPTEFERRRNNRVMEIQGNRNPFIDEPGWATLIWGSKCL